MDRRSPNLATPQGIRALTGGTARPTAPRRSFASLLFGYDIFLSFALGPPPRGTHSYASDLARRLRERDFSVFFSEEEAPPGEQLDSTLRAALLRSKTLVVIANCGTLQEPRWVRKEVEEFRKNHPDRPVITINVGGALQDATLAESAQEWLVYQDKIWLDESAEAVATGIASDQVVERLSIAPTRFKSNVKWRWIRNGAIAMLAALAIGLGITAKIASDNASDAIRQRDEKEIARKGEAKQKAEAERQRDAAIKAQKGEETQRKNALLQWHKAIQNLYQANYNIAKVFEEKAGIGLEDAVKNRSEQEYQKAWLYTIAAVNQDIGPNKRLPISLGRLLLPELRIGAFREAWHSPTPASAAGELWTIPEGEGNSPIQRQDWISETNVGSIGSVAFSPDGKCLAAAYLDRTIRMWNLESGEEVMNLSAYPFTYQTWNPSMRLSGNEMSKLFLQTQSRFNSITFSPNGKFLASGSSDGKILLWDTKSGKAFAEMTGHKEAIESITFSPNGKYLAAGSSDNILSLWHVKNLKCVATFSQHRSCVRSVAFSPDGKRLASGSDDHSIRLWDVESLQELAVLTGHAGSVRSVAFSPDGKRLASGSDDHSIRLWDMQTRKLMAVLSAHTNTVVSVAFGPNGDLLASGSGDHSIRLWNVKSGKEIALRSGHTSYVQSVAFDPAGKRLASGSNDESIRLWDVKTGEELAIFVGHRGWVNCMAFSPDGKLLASGSRDHSVRIWDTEGGQELAVLAGHKSSVWGVAFSPDGKLLASCSGAGSYSDSRDHSIRLWDVESRKELAALTGHTSDVSCVVFSPDGKLLASCSGDLFSPNSSDNSIRLWDVESRKQLAVLTGHSRGVRSVAFHPNGGVLASGARDKTIRIWDVKSGKEVAVLSRHTSDVTSVTFSPDGEYLASGSRDHTIRLWDNIKTGKELMVLSGHTDFVTSLAFSPDGLLLASGSRDHSLRLWNVGYDRPLEGPLREYNCVAFSPDGSLLALGKKAGGISLWDMRSNREYGKLGGHLFPVTSISFNPEGELLSSGSKDTVNLWDVKLLKKLTLFTGCPQSIQDDMSNMIFSLDGKRFAYRCGEDAIMLRGEDIPGFQKISLYPETVFCLVPSPNLLWIASGVRGASKIYLYDVSKGKWTRLDGHRDYVVSLAFSPDSKRLASGSLDHNIRLWDVETGKSLVTLVGHKGIVQSVAFSPDGKRLASGSDDRSIRLWDVQTGKELAVLTGHTDTVLSVTFSPNGGKWLASGSEAGNIRLWNTEDGKELAVLSGHIAPANVAFGPDGSWLVSKAGGSIRLWNIAHLKYYEFGSENLEKIYQASFRLLPYRYEGAHLMPERSKPNLIPVNGYQFPNARFQKLLRPRPPNTDPVEWILENVEKKRRGQTSTNDIKR